MKSIQIKNVRSLKDTGVQKISPITILVGENSSGKSSFLRTFPLIRQSISKRTSGPILWAGDVDDYVDFGSFKESITNDGSSEMGFRFDFSLGLNNLPYSFLRYYELTSLMNLNELNISYEIAIKQKETYEYVSCVKIIVGTDEFIINIDTNVATVNGTPFELCKSVQGEDVHTPYWEFDISPISIFNFQMPSIYSSSEEIRNVIKEKKEKKEKKKNHDKYLLDFSFNELAIMMALSVIGGWSNTIENLDSLNEVLFKENKGAGYYYKTIISELKEINGLIEASDKTQKQRLINLAKLHFLYVIFPSIEELLDTYFRKVHYIAPLRATAERYYRLRNLAVDEIDYQGKNLATFINSLSKPRNNAFQKWTETYFGFRIEVMKSEGNLSLKIKLADSKKTINLSDTGFGYSQILPIITQIWDLANQKESPQKEKIPLVIAIEQPELHLHPAMQAKLAGAFIASVTEAQTKGIQLQFILETHSETLINYFGRAIARKKIEHEDVSVILFQKDRDTNQTRVSTSTYDNDGFLQDWPVGFFNPEE